MDKMKKYGKVIGKSSLVSFLMTVAFVISQDIFIIAAVIMNKDIPDRWAMLWDFIKGVPSNFISQPLFFKNIVFFLMTTVVYLIGYKWLEKTRRDPLMRASTLSILSVVPVSIFVFIEGTMFLTSQTTATTLFKALKELEVGFWEVYPQFYISYIYVYMGTFIHIFIATIIFYACKSIYLKQKEKPAI